MAPASKKGAGSKSSSSRDNRNSASRHSTPVSALTDNTAPPTPMTNTPSGPASGAPKETAYLHTATTALVAADPSIEVLIDKSSALVAKPGDPPSAKDLHVLHDKIRDTVNKFMSKRGEVCDRSMRQLVQRRKERAQIEREQEAARADAERAKVKREEDDRRKEKKIGKKRSHDEMDLDGDEQERKEKREALPNAGAHALARQDGVGIHEGAPAPPSPPIPPGAATVPDFLDAAESQSESGESPTEPPATAPLYERIFGKDPTLGDDPIIYDIRSVHDDMTDEGRSMIYNVKHWPESDLRDLTAGDPPDADFTSAKPANQVNFSTFQTYVEPFIRAYTEEDVAFLKERGDRVTPFIMPQRGPKGYKELWAAEDGLTGTEPPQKPILNPNEPRGGMELMEDDIADQDFNSMGPVMSRLVSAVQPVPTAPKKEGGSGEDANGDASMVNGDNEGAESASGGGGDEFRPATCLPPDAPRPANLPQLDYTDFEQRALQELVHIGLLGPNDLPNYDAHDDDEVAARLRTLQEELRKVSRLNNERKLRVLELMEESMAMQEYSNIADDLDNQVNAAYLKRNRSLAKPNQKKGSSQARPGQKGVATGVVGGRGVSDGVRALMTKRREWSSMVGPVVQYGRPHIPQGDETIFDEATMKKFEKMEREAELEAEAE